MFDCANALPAVWSENAVSYTSSKSSSTPRQTKIKTIHLYDTAYKMSQLDQAKIILE